MTHTYLIAGLGNPGEKYEATRHNVGFKAVDQLQRVENASFSDWKLSKNFSALISEGKYLENRIILLKPLTYMNLSGRSISLVAGFYKVEVEKILVIHDDKDIEIGKFRIRDMGSSGGHNGIKSICENIGTASFKRLKIGIATENIQYKDTADFVLDRFTSNEAILIKEIITNQVIPAVFEIINEGIKSAQNKYSS
jgi:peptidyl-tRNA hydrolase, PTH1 family